MAAPRERKDNGYEDAGSGFGKFRRRPLRRAHATPYDRPATAIRNFPSAADGSGGGNNGWLSRLVDPAQRLLAARAQRLFASVFRKRLPPPPPPQPPETETNQGVVVQQQEAIATNSCGTQEADRIRCEDPSNRSQGGGTTELELVLKQQTFTRSEIDRLTALLQSRIVDQPVGDPENKPEMFPSKVSEDRKDKFSDTPLKDGALESHLISSPTFVGKSVVHEELATPAELARAYMGSRPSKVSPTKLVLRSQPLGANSTALIHPLYPSKSPITALGPRSTGQAGFLENGFVTPRSLGRSAIYSMAWTPYSRGHSTNILQGAGSAVDYGGPSSSSQDAWRNNRSSGSRQGTLKQRSSALDNDVGAVGPIRRIRQKSNLLPASGIASVHGTSFGGVDSSQQLSLTENPVLAGGPSTYNRDNENHSSGFNHVPSKSREMASKIMQQLDVLISTREKSPAKSSPSMLHGPALRSLENIDASKFLETVQDSNGLDGRCDTSLPVAWDSVSTKEDKVEENGPTKSIVSYDKLASVVNAVGANSSLKSNAPEAKTTPFSVLNSASENPPLKKRAFQMSAHEEYLELADGDYPNGPSSSVLTDGREKLDTILVENKISASETKKVEKNPAVAGLTPSAISMSTQKTLETSDGPVAEKSSSLIFQTVPVLGASVQQATVDKQSAEVSDKASPPKVSNVAPSIFRFGERVPSLKEPSGASPPTSTFKPFEKVLQFPFASPSLANNSSGLQFGSSSNTKPESSSSLAVSAHANELVKKEPESGKPDGLSSLKDDALSRPLGTGSTAASTSSATSSSFSFDAPANGSSLSNGSIGSFPPFPSSNIISSVSAASLTADTTRSSSLPISAPAPSFTAGPIFKFGSSAQLSSASSVSATTAAKSTESTEAKAGVSFSNLSSVPLIGTSSTLSSTGSSLFGGNSSAVAITSGIFGGTSTLSSTGGSTFSSTSASGAIFSFNCGAIASHATNQSQGFNLLNPGTAPSIPGTSVASTTESKLPNQFGSSPPSPSFGLAGSTGFSFGSTSTSNTKLFTSGTIFGLTSPVSFLETTTNSSSSNVSSVFGSSWQTPTSPVFAPTSNTSSAAGFFFGAPSTSAATSITTLAFGSSTNVISCPISFNSQAVFGNSNSGFPVGSSPSGNGDQMNMEDSMAEDTAQAATHPPTAVFGQQPILTSSSGFGFGSATPPGVNQLGSTVPAVSSPFQFGGQPNMATPPNPSPFQLSGSLEFNAGGSFSLGTGGGDKSNRRTVKVKRTQRKK